MKRTLFFLTAILMCGAMYAQSIFTVVGGNAYDGFVSIRQTPSSKAKVLGKLYNTSHGLGAGIKLEQQGSWTKVKTGNTVGWCFSKYVQEQDWYNGNGAYVLVAAKSSTPIYDDYDEVFTSVKQGTIIADQFQDNDDYYTLSTAHDCLHVRKSDVIKKRRQ